ncbi:hypothetical protein FQA39_LY04866 [Lamprigera yunnana]|nr:hypothetical protein FQA39_LY04866 [Lamprigera yunnana]
MLESHRNKIRAIYEFVKIHSLKEKEKRHKPTYNPDKFPENAFLKEHPRRGVVKDGLSKKHRIDKLKRPYFRWTKYCIGEDLQNIDENIGVNIVKLGKAKLFSNSHYVYYPYNLTNILTEFNNLKDRKINLQNTLKQGTIDFKRELETHNNILNFNHERLSNKIKFIFNTRSKRGAMNGLGSIIKIISGNLDASVGEKYDNIFKKVRQKENNLQSQVLEKKINAKI